MKRTGILIACMLFGFTLTFAQGKAGISVSETTHDFGTVYEEDGNATHEFIITNTGDAPLEITRATATCGCTTPDWTKTPIEPGKTGTVKVSYMTKNRIGPISKSVSIYSNAQEGPLVVHIRGQVVSKSATNTQQSRPVDVQLKQNPVSIEPAKK